MNPTNILVVEDDNAISEMLVMILEHANFCPRAVASAEAAQVSLVDQAVPDLMLIDWMLPGISGIDLARRLKQDELYRYIPLILLTARGEEEDKVRGLEIGADDYVTKPFSPKELVARIKAVLRRSGKNTEQQLLNIDDFVLDIGKHLVTIAGSTVEVSPTEFKLLHFFMTHQDNVYSRSQLLDQVWGRNAYIEERTVDVHIRRLRKILIEYGKANLIQTVRGFGYRFSAL